jgi:hypothetical protein
MSSVMAAHSRTTKGRSYRAEAAKRQAAMIAAELAQDGDLFRDFLIRVVDDEGNEVGRLPVVTGFGDIAC